MIDVGHIGPDKEDRCVECEFRLGRTAHYWIKVRDNYRNYDQAPFLKPKTTQQEFYSEVLKGPTIAIASARNLWYLAVDMKFQDGVIPSSPRLRQKKLEYKVEQKNQSAEERRSEPRSDMVGIHKRATDKPSSRYT